MTPQPDALESWLAAITEKWERMPSGPYKADNALLCRHRGFDIKTWMPLAPVGNGTVHMQLNTEACAEAFAALDRETVLALVAVVRCALETQVNGAIHLDTGEDGEMLLHNLSEAMLASAIDTLRALAQKRESV